jgi:hypothetical protein
MAKDQLLEGRDPQAGFSKDGLFDELRQDRVDVRAWHERAGDPGPISTVTDAVLETVSEWQNRPLEASYAQVFFDALRVKIRDEGYT